MKNLLCAFAFLLSLSSFAASLPKACYDTVDGGQFCSTDNLGKVQVYIFNAGWCPACNQEMDELPGVYNDLKAQFKEDSFIFASLSGSGNSQSEQPDQSFLQQWKQQHNIPFIVAGKFRDYGNAFGAQGYIPFSVVIDKLGNITKSGTLSGSEIGSEVRRLLGGS